MNKRVQIPFWDSNFISLWHIPRSGVAVSQGISVFNFLQNFCNIFHNDYVCLVAKSCQTLVTPWTVAHLALLSVGFSRQEYWSGLQFLLEWIFSTQGPNPSLAGGFFTTESPGKLYIMTVPIYIPIICVNGSLFSIPSSILVTLVFNNGNPNRY